MEKIHVMIVEDSSVVRQFLTHVIGSDPRLEVVAAVDSGEAALRVLHRVSPDVISMDIHLPGINGYEATRQIMEEKPTPIVVVSGSIDRSEQKSSIQALRAGALAVIEKPAGTSHEDYEALAERLCTQLAIMSQVRVVRQRFNRDSRLPPADDGFLLPHSPTLIPPAAGPFDMLGIVASTGGPGALQTVMNALGSDFPLPVLVVQHITMSFHDSLVAWLGDVAPQRVVTAAMGQVPQPGHVYVAPADRHLELDGPALVLRRSEPVCAQRPSGTLLFRSLARSLAGRVLGVLLTGMGEDGAEGLKEMRSAGGYTIAEDESTAVVYGMPAAAVRLRAVCELLPLGEIGPRIVKLVSRGGAAHTPRIVEQGVL